MGPGKPLGRWEGAAGAHGAPRVGGGPWGTPGLQRLGEGSGS